MGYLFNTLLLALTLVCLIGSTESRHHKDVKLVYKEPKEYYHINEESASEGYGGNSEGYDYSMAAGAFSEEPYDRASGVPEGYEESSSQMYVI